MAILSVFLKAQDEISSIFEKVAQSGERAISAFENAGTAAEDALGRAASSAEGTIQATDNWTDAVGNYNKEAKEAIYSTEELVQMGYKTEDALGEAAAAADGATGSLEGFGDEAEAAGRKGEEGMRKSSNGIKDLQSVLAAAGITKMLKEVFDGFMSCSKGAAEYETSIAKVATIADTGEKSLADMSTEIIAYSNETGVAATEMAEATYQAISAGVDTADSVAFAGTATKLAIGGFTDATTAVDVLTTAINAYGLEADDASRIGDLLITTQNLGKTSVDLLAQSVGKVIPLASAYNMNMENLSTTMAVMTANGIATAEATTYTKSILSELGDTGSTVAGILEDETGMSFSQLMDSGYSLGDVLEIIGDSVGGDATAFSNLWSSTEAGVGALSLFNSGADKFNSVLSEMESSAGAAETAYSTMADTTGVSEERMSTAFENLKIAAGDVLNPSLTKIYNTVTNITTGITTFVKKHPSVIAAITGIATAVGVVAGAIAAYTFVTNGAELAMRLFNAAMDTNPIFLAVTAIAAVTAGMAAFGEIMMSNIETHEDLSHSSQQQYDKLQSLNAQYEIACTKYGESSAQAASLRGEIELLSADFEANKTTVSQFAENVKRLVESNDDVIKSYDTSKTGIEDNYTGVMGLITELENLVTANDNTIVSHEKVEAIIQRLNEEVPDLALNYEDVISGSSSAIQAIKDYAQAQYEMERQEAQRSAWAELDYLNPQLVDAEAEAYANFTDVLDKFGISEETAMKMTSLVGDNGNVQRMKNAVVGARDTWLEAKSALEENEAKIAEIEGEWAEVAEAEAEAAAAPKTYEEAVNEAVSSVQEDLNTLVEEYNSAYDAAYQSVSSTIGLFNTMSTETEMSVGDMSSAMQSQVEWLNTYSENLRLAAQYGLSDGLIASLSDGSTESAGYINAIVANIESLGGSTEGLSDEAAAFIDDFNSQFEGVEEAKSNFSSQVASMSTDFDSRMGEIEARMQEAIDGMNMEADAEASARATITAYADTIRSMTGTVSDAAAAVARAASSQLSNLSMPSVAGHASGTVWAPEDVYVAGEDGPELILGARGTEVFPASETDRIISALTDRTVETSAPDDGRAAVYGLMDTAGGTDTGTGDRKITLEINGKGNIQVDGGGGADKDAILEVLYEYIKPVLSEILTQEAFEEGDGSYGY